MALRKKWWITALLALAAVVPFAACTLPWPVSAGDAAPALDVQWLQGEPIDPRNPDGHIVVVEAWATWCGPCVGSIPELDAVARRYADRGVRVVAVAVMDDLAEVQKFVARRGPELAYTIAFDHTGQVKKRWRTEWFSYYVPCTFVVDREGRIETITSPYGIDDVLQRMLHPRASAEKATVERLVSRHWDAEETKDAAAVTAIAEEAAKELPHRAFPWAWQMRAAAAGDARDAVAKRGFAAVRGDVEEVARLVRSAADLGCLPAIAADASAVLAPASWLDGAFVISVARLRAAQAVGKNEFVAVVDAAITGLASRPADLAALARELARPRYGADGTAVPLPNDVLAAALRLVEAAIPTFAPWHVLSAHHQLLVETGAVAERIDAAGRRAVDAMRGSAIELNRFAWDLLMDERHLPATRAIALLAAEALADAPYGDAPNHLDTLALARFENGDVDGAIATQERAIAGQREPSASFTERLERYRRAKAASVNAPR